MSRGPLVAGGFCVLIAGRVLAFPDGAPWEAAWTEEGCSQCHFDAEVTTDSPALEIAGLPERIDPGKVYRLTLTLSAESMHTAGFLLSVVENEAPIGRFEAVDERTSAQASQVRSTKQGSLLVEPGRAEWVVDWEAPATIVGPVSFALWANAANEDQSPFGDMTHFRSWQVVAAGHDD